MKKNCLNCNKEMNVKPSHYKRKKYCSRGCQTAHQKANPPQYWKELSNKVLVNCSYCNNDFFRKPSAINTTNFCNRECKRLYQLKNGHLINQHLKKLVELQCNYCNESFSVPPNRQYTAKYCSKTCLGKANGKRAHNQLNRKKILECSYCKNTVVKKRSTIRALNFCGKECMSKYYVETGMFTGENSGTWNGGKINYYGPNWHSQRRKARERDNYTCQDCGIHEKDYGQELSVHHIKPFKEFNGDWKNANKLSNLISLCEYPCHRKRHSKMVDDIV